MRSDTARLCLGEQAGENAPLTVRSLTDELRPGTEEHNERLHREDWLSISALTFVTRTFCAPHSSHVILKVGNGGAGVFFHFRFIDLLVVFFLRR